MRRVSYFLSALLVLSHITCAAPVGGSLGIVQRTPAENTETAKDTPLDPGFLATNAIAVREETEQTENTSSDSTNNPGLFIRADAVKRADAAVASPTPNNPGRVI